MRALFIEHDDLSKPGLLGAAFTRRGFDIVEFCVAAESGIPAHEVEFPAPDDFDVVVAMGAPWSVYNPDIAGWVGAELELLSHADSCRIPVLGVCFGGQLLAEAHGGTVVAAIDEELGWTTVSVGDHDLIEPGPWFQWHSDCWSVPPDATELASTPRASQAFVLRRNLAVQFHPELTGEILDSWIARTGDLVRHDLDELRQQTVDQHPAAVGRAERLVSGFLGKVAIA